MSEMRGVKSENRRGMVGMVFNLLLTAVPTLIFYIVYMRFYIDSTSFYAKGNYLFSLIYMFLLVVLMGVYSGYKLRQYRTRELVFSFALASFITNFVMFFVLCLIARHMLRPWGVILATVVQWFAETGLYILARVILPLVEPRIPALYIRGEDEQDTQVEKKFDSRRTRFYVRASVSGEQPWADLRAAMEGYEAVLLGDIDKGVREQIINYCYRTGRDALLVPDMTDIMVGSAIPLITGDSLLYDLNTRGVDLGYRTVKRLMDILAAAAGLLILSPLMIAVAIAIHAQDGGPVFYRQVRLTKGGRYFRLTKFRSMIVNAESGTGAVLARKEDDRITKIGRFIRATRIDELPQLWNILKGDMSLVGPRPERPEFYRTICAEYPEFEYRLKVKAGLTGYAQLYGKYNTTFADKARLDLYYIQHASLLWDLQLIFYTLKIIFIRESTEGVDAPAPAEERQTENAEAR